MIDQIPFFRTELRTIWFQCNDNLEEFFLIIAEKFAADSEELDAMTVRAWEAEDKVRRLELGMD